MRELWTLEIVLPRDNNSCAKRRFIGRLCDSLTPLIEHTGLCKYRCNTRKASSALAAMVMRRTIGLDEKVR